VYNAILYGNVKLDTQTITTAIGRSKNDRKKMATYPLNTPNAKNAITHMNILERLNGYTLAEFRLETGRTHQIRVHSQYIGHPVIGDPVYASKRYSFDLPGQCLHAKTIGFIHPITHENLYFDSELPQYFRNVLDKLRKQNRYE